MLGVEEVGRFRRVDRVVVLIDRHDAIIYITKLYNK